MADDKLDDWKNKASEIANKSKTAASKGLQSAKEGTKTLVADGKSIAEKGLKKTQKAVQKAVDSTEKFVITKMDRKKSASKKSTSKKSKKDGKVDVTTENKTENFSKLTVAELKIRLKTLKLSLSGKKAVLIERLSNNNPEPSPIIPSADVFMGTHPEHIDEETNDNVPLEKEENSDELEFMYEKMKEIEIENPEVLLPLEPAKQNSINMQLIVSNMLFYATGLTLMAYSILLLIPSLNDTLKINIISENQPLLNYIIPTWFLPEQMEPLPSDIQLPFVIFGSLVVFCSGVLLMLKKKRGVDFAISYFFGILIICRIIYLQLSDVNFTYDIILSLFNDLAITLILCGWAITPIIVKPPTETPKEKSIFDYSGIFTDSAKEQYTGNDVDRLIDEGLIMDFRAEVARPPQPRARARFEPYEKLLLTLSFVMWPITLLVTGTYENGSVPLTNGYSPNDAILGASWAISLFILIVLIRFDKSARNSGMYGKEKESYGRSMELWNDAQQAHYKYVELRAAAEAQQIIEKYPQLGASASANPSEV
jgi:hypothetical protein